MNNFIEKMCGSVAAKIMYYTFCWPHAYTERMGISDGIGIFLSVFWGVHGLLYGVGSML